MKEKIAGLDGIRGIFSIIVVAYHIYMIEGFLGISDFADHTIGYAGIAVQMFFLLSAFSIMYGYSSRINTIEDLKLFYIGRIKRIAPLFLFTLIIHIILNIINNIPTNFWEIIGSASMLFGFMPQYQESLVYAGWAVGIIMIFYLLFPLICVFCKGKINSCIFFCVTLLLNIVYTNHYGVGINLSHINIICQLVYFAAGVLAFQYLDYFNKMEMKKRKIVYYVSLVLAAVSLHLFCNVNGLFIIVSYWCIVTNQINNKDIIVNNPVFRFLGKISYQIYLLHMVIYRILYGIGVYKYFDSVNNYVYRFLIKYLITLFITIAVSFLIYKADKKIKNAKFTF